MLNHGFKSMNQKGKKIFWIINLFRHQFDVKIIDFLVKYFMFLLVSIFHYYRDWYNPKKKDRLLMQIASGYGIPLIISIFTLIVEFTSPRCAIYRPRFGEETCFFSGRITFASWNIYLQISIMYMQILSSLNVISIYF